MAKLTHSSDTTVHAHAAMIAKFATMTIADRAAKLEDLNDMCTKLALAGIRDSHGDLAPNDLRWHLAARRYGTQLANEAYGARPEAT